MRITYTLDLDLDDRKAIGWELSQRHDEFEPATHEQVREFFEDAIEYRLNDLLVDYENRRQSDGSEKED